METELIRASNQRAQNAAKAALGLARILGVRLPLPKSVIPTLERITENQRFPCTDIPELEDIWVSLAPMDPKTNADRIILLRIKANIEIGIQALTDASRLMALRTAQSAYGAGADNAPEIAEYALRIAACMQKRDIYGKKFRTLLKTLESEIIEARKQQIEQQTEDKIPLAWLNAIQKIASRTDPPDPKETCGNQPTVSP